MQPQTPANPSGTMLEHQLAIGMTTSYAIQVLKRLSFVPWVREDTFKINRIVSVAVAFFTSLGLRFAFEGSISSGGVITIAVPSISAITDTVVHVILQYGIQETVYTKMIKKPQPTDAELAAAQPLVVLNAKAAGA